MTIPAEVDPGERTFFIMQNYMPKQYLAPSQTQVAIVRLGVYTTGLVLTLTWQEQEQDLANNSNVTFYFFFFFFKYYNILLKHLICLMSVIYLVQSFPSQIIGISVTSSPVVHTRRHYGNPWWCTILYWCIILYVGGDDMGNVISW